MAKNISVPDIGDFKDVEIIEVLVKPGDNIKKNDPIVTLESDKSSVEVPSPFEGKISEPRKGLRSGNIKNSFCIPFGYCLNQNGTFKEKEKLREVFSSRIKNLNEKNIVFSCGSGVTACVLALAYSLINDKYQPCIYDGSWAEYGII